MNKLPEIVIHEDGYEALLEEVKAIRSEMLKVAIEVSLQAKWLAGKTIAEEKKAYGKNTRIANDLGISAETVGDGIGFYKQFPEENGDKAYMKLPDCNGKLNFSNIRKALNHRLPKDCDHEWEEITKGRCKKCGTGVSEDPNNKHGKYLPNEKKHNS